jgi:hypothetical protein
MRRFARAVLKGMPSRVDIWDPPNFVVFSARVIKNLAG